jgi:hypothetical protein
MTIEELNCLMDGVEIAHNKIDEIIAFILNNNISKRRFEDNDGDDVDDYWEDN